MRTVRKAPYSQPIAIDRLPMTHVSIGTRGTKAIKIFAGGGLVMVTGFFLFGLTGGYLKSTRTIVIFATPILFMAVFLLICILLDRARFSITFTPNELQFKHEHLWMKASWAVPVAEYTGVVTRSELRASSSSRSDSTYWVHLIELQHPDKNKGVTLVESRTEQGLRSQAETAARVLNLSCFEYDGDSLVERSEDEFDLSVRDLAAKGNISVEGFSLDAIPKQIEVETAGEDLRLILSRPVQSFPLGVIVFSSIAGGYYYFFGLPPLPVVFFYVLFTCIGLYRSSLHNRIFRPHILLSSSSITFENLGIGGKGRFQSLARDIEDVRIEEGANDYARTLCVITDAGPRRLRLGLNSEDSEWVKNCILSTLTAGVIPKRS